ncbi:hypothetical protein JMG10_06540 [Nostoc ellipsosporum NOK]|nr:hypothetical protein [Nostoc ellipsosporum NOK]
MRKTLLCILLFSFVLQSKANFVTPGTGVTLTLTDLVSLSGGIVTFNGTDYLVSDTIEIRKTDVLNIAQNAKVLFAPNTFIWVRGGGTLIVNPPTGVTFTAQNQTAGYLGLRIDTSNNTSLKKLTFEYAVSCRLSDSHIRIDDCTFRYNNNSTSTSFGNGALALFRSSPVITNSRFIDNKRAAIQGGANIFNAPKMTGCLFQGNGTAAQNVPQINLGATSANGEDTVKILNCQIIDAGSVMTGGIGFLPLGNAYVVISNNVIRGNRYGVFLNGGAGINALVSYNVIDANNIEGNSNTGGSGISLSGGSATSKQNTIITGNIFRNNLWGVTIVGSGSTLTGPQPNLGNLNNTDTTDDGKNYFIGNTNNTTPGISVYNNSSDPIMAQNNYWGVSDATGVEATIFHKTDNATLGLITYNTYVASPSALLTLTASLTTIQTSMINWSTSAEVFSRSFEVESSTDNSSFTAIGTVAAAGFSNATRSYSFEDASPNWQRGVMYYRLRMIDALGRAEYSQVVEVRLPELNGFKLYPTEIPSSRKVIAEFNSATSQTVQFRFFSASGQLLGQQSVTALQGRNRAEVTVPAIGARGYVYVRVTGQGIETTVPLRN